MTRPDQAGNRFESRRQFLAPSPRARTAKNTAQETGGWDSGRGPPLTCPNAEGEWALQPTTLLTKQQCPLNVNQPLRVWENWAWGTHPRLCNPSCYAPDFRLFQHSQPTRLEKTAVRVPGSGVPPCGRCEREPPSRPRASRKTGRMKNGIFLLVGCSAFIPSGAAIE